VQGPLVLEAFELYSTGEWPLSALHAHLRERGLGNNGVPLARSRLASTLANPFYVGTLRWKGSTSPVTMRRLCQPIFSIGFKRRSSCTGMAIADTETITT
jgi:hypothetical protein